MEGIAENRGRALQKEKEKLQTVSVLNKRLEGGTSGRPGPGGYYSPRQRMPCNSRCDGAKCVT